MSSTFETTWYISPELKNDDTRAALNVGFIAWFVGRSRFAALVDIHGQVHAAGLLYEPFAPIIGRAEWPMLISFPSRLDKFQAYAGDALDVLREVEVVGYTTIKGDNVVFKLSRLAHSNTFSFSRSFIEVATYLWQDEDMGFRIEFTDVRSGANTLMGSEVQDAKFRLFGLDEDSHDEDGSLSEMWDYLTQEVRE